MSQQTIFQKLCGCFGGSSGKGDDSNKEDEKREAGQENELEEDEKHTQLREEEEEYESDDNANELNATRKRNTAATTRSGDVDQQQQQQQKQGSGASESSSEEKAKSNVITIIRKFKLKADVEELMPARYQELWKLFGASYNVQFKLNAQQLGNEEDCSQIETLLEQNCIFTMATGKVSPRIFKLYTYAEEQSESTADGNGSNTTTSSNNSAISHYYLMELVVDYDGMVMNVRAKTQQQENIEVLFHFLDGVLNKLATR